jgi:CheY-like chemotaxis protein
MSQRRILIVEDEAVTSVMLEKTLKELGYEVVGSAFDGREAIEIAREKRPDLILMDIRIQGDMDGIETAKQIYQQFNIPSIYLTAHSDEDTIKRAVESGPFGYLIKPFKERELYSNIEMVAHKHKLYRTTTARNEPEEPPQVPERRVEERTSAPAPASAPAPQRPPDLRLGILAVQAIPHPIILLNTNGTIAFTNTAFRNFFRMVSGSYDSTASSIEDLPDLCKKIWISGKDRFKEGKGFSITGPVQVKGTPRRYRVDMLPIVEKGVLHFIVAIILPGENSTGTGPGLSDSSGNLLEEVINTIKEIRFLASSEETYRLHQIVTRADDVLKNLGEIKHISYPGQTDKKSGQMLTG